MAQEILTSDDTELSLRISQVLIRMGIPISTKGYALLHRMISIVCRDPSQAKFVTKTLYPRVARENKTKVASLEHACRRAIAKAYEFQYITTLEGYIDNNGNRLGPGAFIVLTAQKIKSGEL